jgi:uncharacterized membrane protein
MNYQQFLREGSTSANRPHWASLAGGAALAALGITRKSWAGAAVAGAGAYLVYCGVKNSDSPREIEVDRAVTINKPAEELFRFWRNFENLPSFMDHLESVTQHDGNSHWVVKGPLGKKLEWDANISQERPNELIRWHSLPNSSIQHTGWVQFSPAPGNRGTVVRVHLRYEPLLGKAGSALAIALGKHPEQMVREELRHFKALMEAGEIPTTRGQSAGPRGAKGKTYELLLGEKSRQRQKPQLVTPRRVPA